LVTFDHFVSNNKTTDAVIILPTGVGKTGRVLIITPQLVIKDGVVGFLDPEYHDNFWLRQNVFEKMSDLPCLIEYEGKETRDEVLKMANSLINRVPSDFFDMIIVDDNVHVPLN